MTDVILQGTDCYIEAKNLIDLRTGLPMNVTGYPVHVVARARYQRRVLGQRMYRFGMNEPVVSEWSTTPTGTQGTVVAGGLVVDMVQIHITPLQSSSWRCPLVVVQAELTNPVTGEVSRIVNRVFEVDFEATNAH